MISFVELIFVFRFGKQEWSDCLLIFDKWVGYGQFLVKCYSEFRLNDHVEFWL